MLDETGLAELHLTLDARLFRFLWAEHTVLFTGGGFCFVLFLTSSSLLCLVWYLSAFCPPMAGQICGPKARECAFEEAIECSNMKKILSFLLHSPQMPEATMVLVDKSA